MTARVALAAAATVMRSGEAGHRSDPAGSGQSAGLDAAARQRLHA